MNAIVLPHPQLGTHRPQPRLSTEVRSLRKHALWITLHRDTATGLQNFTPDLVQEFRSLVEDLHDDRQRRPLPPYAVVQRSEEHTSELQSLMRITYAVFCLNKKNNNIIIYHENQYGTTS